MEPATAVELFNRAPDQSVKFSVYTGDDDSTTEAHIREKVTYEVEKKGAIIHMKRSLTTRLYNLSQNEKFDNCPPLSQKVINYLVKFFSYATAQNKGDSKGIQAAIKSIVPHAFGDHSNCETSWCKFKSNPGTYKHKELPYGKDLQGKKLELELNNIFNDYSTDAVAEKLAPLKNSQRNEALNSEIGSKNPKIRFYGGSESNDFRVACGVAQTNLRYTYISSTLEALNIEPGNFCEMYGEKMTNHVQKDKLRKSSLAYKRGRANARWQDSAQTAKKEAKEGKTYETGIGLNLDLSILPASPMKEIETIVSPYTPRPLATKVKYDENKFYNFLIFDTETNTTGKSAELSQLSATDQTGLYQFSTYTLPVHDIDHFASKLNKLKIVKVNGERQQRSKYTIVEGSNVTVSWLCFTVSRKSQVTHKQECRNGAPRSQFSHI